MTFKELEAAEKDVITEYGKRLSQCVRKEGGIVNGILLFVARNRDDLPDRIPGGIRDGIADYAGIERNTFQTRLTQARKRIRDYWSKQHEQEKKRESVPPDLLAFYRTLLKLRLHFTGDELKAAFREKAKEYHPDRYMNASPRDRENAATLMRQIITAYEVLQTQTNS